MGYEHTGKESISGGQTHALGPREGKKGVSLRKDREMGVRFET